MPEEIFKEIEKHPNYVVDRFGNVYRKYYKSDQILYPLKPDTSNGYMRVDLDGKKEYVSRLVLEAFNPQPHPGWKVFYVDRNTLNCKLENLVWLAPSQIQMFSKYKKSYRKEILGIF